MRFFKNWLFVPVGVLIFISVLFVAPRFQEALEGSPTATWSPTGDPLDSLQHTDALLCVKRGDLQEVETKVTLRYWPGPLAEHQTLYPTATRGECGILDITQFAGKPVMMEMREDERNALIHAYVTFWDDNAHQGPEGTPEASWSTVELGFQEPGVWWIQFRFISRSLNMPAVTIRID